MSFPLKDFIINYEDDSSEQKQPLDLFEEKYRPKDISEFYGNDDAIRVFKEWEANLENRKKLAFCIVYGPKSSGKSTFVELMLKNYHIKEFADNMERKDLFNSIHKLLNTRSVAHQISEKNRNTAIVIDNAENYLGEGKTFDEFCSIVEKSARTVPVVLIVSKMKKKMRKSSRFLLIELKPTSTIIMNKIAKEIIKTEEITIDAFSKSYIIEHCKNDLRYMLHVFKLISYSLDKTVTQDNVERIIEFSKQDRFYEASALVDRIFNKNGISGTGGNKTGENVCGNTETFRQKINLYSEEQYSVEQLLWSNLGQVSDIEIVGDVLEGLGVSDIFQTVMYEQQNFDDYRNYSILESCVKAEVLIPPGRYRIGKNTINNLQLNQSKNKVALAELRTDEKYLTFVLLKYEMEIQKQLIDMDYETYSKLCSIYKLNRKTRKYFESIK